MKTGASTMSTTRIGLVIALFALAGCGGSKSAVTAPSAMPGVTTTPPLGSVLAMMGTVSDSAFRPLPDARIEVLDGSQAGTITVSNSRGEFAFWGTIEDNTRFRATRDGYTSSVETLQSPCATCSPSPSRWVHFVLNAVTPSVNMAGDYTVTFTGTCDNLPTDVRTRTYEATIGSPPYDGYVSVPLRGGTFIKGWDSLPMGVESDYVAFWIEILVDQLAPNTYLTVNALAAARVGTEVKEKYTFPLDGSIDYCVTSDTGSYEDCYHRPSTATHARCASGQLTLTRR